MSTLRSLRFACFIVAPLVGYGRGGVLREIPKPPLTVGAHFGTSCAADGAHIAVGAFLDRNETGATVVYNKDASAMSVLRPSDLRGGANFGCALSIAAGFLAVGAQNDDDGAESVQHGSVYLFALNASQDHNFKIVPPTRRAGQFFGCSLALEHSGSALAIGATNGAGVGAVYLFMLGTGPTASTTNPPIEIFPPPDLRPGDNFGISVGVVAIARGAHLVVAGANHAHSLSGVVIAFYVDAGGRAQRDSTLMAADAVEGAYFGSSVAVAKTGSRTVIVVGSPWADDGRGAVYIFVRHAMSAFATPWRRAKLTTPAAASSAAAFGISLAIEATTAEDVLDLIVGAWADSTTGTAYMYNGRFDSHGVVALHMVARLQPQNISSTSFFGSSVALSRSAAVIGADGEQSTDGAAYTYDLSWRELLV